MHRLRFRFSPAMVVAVVALVAAMAGTAFAAGQLVTIVDPSTNQGAKVDGTGALKTTVTGSVRVTDQPSFATSTVVPNFYANNSQATTLFKTTATLAISRVRTTLREGNGPWGGALFVVQPQADGSCVLDYTNRLAVTLEQPNSSSEDTFPTPVIIKPTAAGKPWCLMATFGPNDMDAGDAGHGFVDLSGYVVSGSFSAPAAAPLRTAARRTPLG